MVLDSKTRFEAGGRIGVMNTRRMALDYIKRERRCFKEAKLAFDDEDYLMTVRRSQELELIMRQSLNQLLNFLTKMVPKALFQPQERYLMNESY